MTGEELRRLFDPEEPEHNSDSLRCELEDQHAGPHWSLGNNEGDSEDCAALTWDDLTRMIADRVEFCPVVGFYPKRNDPEWICTLVLDHPGRHCFQIDGESTSG